MKNMRCVLFYIKSINYGWDNFEMGVFCVWIIEVVETMDWKVS